MKYLLGIDVGTTGTKTILFRETGEPVAHAYRAYPTKNKRVGESEQDANDWWRAVVETVREVACEPEHKDNIAAISLSTQGGTLVPVDSLGGPLRDAIVWNDIRFTEEREEFISEVGAPDTLYEKTGWALGTNLPLLALRYIKDKEPEIFERAAAFLTVPSFISMKMTGRAVVDFSNAGIEQLVDVRRGEYDKALLDFAGVDESRLATLSPSSVAVGKLTCSAADELGINRDALFVTGAHDQYAVALGAGAVSDGDILIGSGTCWVVTAIGNKEDFASGLSQSRSAVDGLWGTLSSLSTGGVCLEWLRKNIAPRDDGTGIDYEALNREVADIPAAEDGLFFYPFMGKCDEGKCFNKGAFVGMDLSHNRFHLARAVMEGVVFETLWMLEDFKTKPKKSGLTLSGGAAKSAVWSQILADVSGFPIRIPEISDLACVGAAIMAGVGAGLFSSAREGYERFSVSESVIMPRPEMTAKYKELFEKYKTAARALGNSY